MGRQRVTTLGFLGLGSMGRAMAERLLAAGHDVVVWNRSSGAIDALAAQGATAADSPERALSADVSFSMLANDAAVREIILPALPSAAGGIHVVMASISPGLSSELAIAAAAGHDVGYIAAPVLGRPEVAMAGNLNILVAGHGDAIERVTGYLEILGRRVWRIGEVPAMAHAVKAAVNYNIIHALQAIGESVAMTERLGVDPELFTELLSNTLFGGVVYTGYGSMIARRAYELPGFHIALGRKDLALAEAIAAETKVVPATLPALVDVFEKALADPELRDYDWSAIAEVSRLGL